MPETTALLPGPDKESAEPERRRRRQMLKGLAVLASAMVVGVAVLAGAAAYYANKFDHNVNRIDGVFAKIPESARPAKAPGKAQDFLLVGSDIRAPGATTGAAAGSRGGGRSDTLMIIHVAADQQSAHVISIPRDSWVDIPGRGKNKINAAYAFGGPSLLVQTVEALTKIRIDHYLAVDFAGFAAMTDAVGGVVIDVPVDSYDSNFRTRWKAGPQRMDGKRALLFVRQRYGLPGGDFDRINHQHLFLRALMAKATDGGQLSNPVKLTRLLNGVTKSLSVDDGLSSGGLRALALSLRNLDGSSVQFLTVPVKGTGRVGTASVVFLDTAHDEVLYRAVRTDTMASYRPVAAK